MGNIKNGSLKIAFIPLIFEAPFFRIHAKTTISPIIKPKANCTPHVAPIVIKYLHQLFLPNSALYKNGTFDMVIPPLPLNKKIASFNI